MTGIIDLEVVDGRAYPPHIAAYWREHKRREAIRRKRLIRWLIKETVVMGLASLTSAVAAVLIVWLVLGAQPSIPACCAGAIAPAIYKAVKEFVKRG